ncbi:hypothetical protein L1987_85065 [Smallanthus sonchifolius]|uniref:Uncharacterized protein n=1 Tax=Smallanthus sonchifolius TaxID=185202 RepID=A0ACB8XWP6_9ASTR|nr:hypothetical protein L1987_85065 [Smallanthus sonchifolius]
MFPHQGLSVGLLRQATYTTARLGDATLPAAQGRNYRNACNDFYKIITDGVLALWKGHGPTGLRVMAWNSGMHASYHQSVEYFPGKKSITKIVILFLKFEAMLELVIRLHIDLLHN